MLPLIIPQETFFIVLFRWRIVEEGEGRQIFDDLFFES